MMFRKALEVAVHALHPGGKGRLVDRINALPAENGITPAMMEWAHVIRQDGNDAAHHDEPFTDLQATALQAFTETFLNYAFTLPERVRQRGAET